MAGDETYEDMLARYSADPFAVSPTPPVGYRGYDYKPSMSPLDVAKLMVPPGSRPQQPTREDHWRLPSKWEVLANMVGPRVGPLPRISNPIRAYHGSPHDFDKFDLSKIGTGEGVQAYGHGLYFAENEGVAKAYRDSLSGSNIDARNYYVGDKMVTDLGARSEAAQKAVRPFVQHPDQARTIVRNIMDELAEMPGKPASAYLTEYTPHRGWEDAYRAGAESLGDLTFRHNPGRMYEVSLHATPEQFLDWDKPLSGQSPQIRDTMLPLGEKFGLKTELAQWPRKLDDPQYYVNGIPHEAIRDTGIPGIRYLDQGSRDKALAMLKEGKTWADVDATPGLTRNAVVWSPEIIEILRKYAMPPAIAGPALATMLDRYDKPSE